MHIDPVRFAPALTWLYSTWIKSIRYEYGDFIDRLDELTAAGRPLMLAIYHEELFALTGFGPRFLLGRMATVASDSRDGELIARVLERIGFLVARGSSTRGGLKALLQLKRYMERDGRIGVVTIDGPRGPRRKAKDGTVFLSQKSNALLVPLRARCSSTWVADRSWDKFQVPKPFSTCTLYFGEPLEITQEKLTPELMATENARLENALQNLWPNESIR
jgi:Uncharacterized protein conserved in bacteria